MKTNKGAASTLISVVIVVLVILGIWYWAKSKPTTTDYSATPTGENTNNNVSSAPNVVTKNASFIAKTSAVLNGDVNPMGAQTSYWYEYGESASLGSISTPSLVGGGNIVYSAPKGVSGLKVNTTYYYQLVAENENGKSIGSVNNFTTLSSTATAPVVTFVSPLVDARSATAITQNSAVLNGSFSARGPSAAYWFEYGKSFNLGSVTPVTSAAASTSTVFVSSSIANLEPNTTYYFRLDGQNVYGTITSNISVFTTQPATPPANPPTGKAPTVSTSPATNVTTTTAMVSGTVNPNGSATTYYFRFGESTRFGRFDLDQRTEETSAGSGSVATTRSFTVTGLEPGTTYYYQLVAENDFGTTNGSIHIVTTK